MRLILVVAFRKHHHFRNRCSIEVTTALLLQCSGKSALAPARTNPVTPLTCPDASSQQRSLFHRSLTFSTFQPCFFLTTVYKMNEQKSLKSNVLLVQLFVSINRGIFWVSHCCKSKIYAYEQCALICILLGFKMHCHPWSKHRGTGSTSFSRCNKAFFCCRVL